MNEFIQQQHSYVITTQNDNSFKPGSDEFTDGLDYSNSIEQQPEYLGNQQLNNPTNVENESLFLPNSSTNKQIFENNSEINFNQNNKTSMQAQNIPKEQQKKSEQYTTSNYRYSQINYKVKCNQVQSNNQQYNYQKVNQFNNNSNNDQFAYNYNQNNQISMQCYLAKFSNTYSSNQPNSNSGSTYQVSYQASFNNNYNQTNSSQNSNDLFERSYNNIHQNACQGILDETLNNINSYQQNSLIDFDNSQVQEVQPISNPNINLQEKNNQQNYFAQQINQQIYNQKYQHIQFSREQQFQNNSSYGELCNVCVNNTSTLNQTNQQQQQQNTEMTDNNFHEEDNLCMQPKNNLHKSQQIQKKDQKDKDEYRKYKNIYQWVYKDLKQIIQDSQQNQVLTELFRKHEKKQKDKKFRAKEYLFKLFVELKNNNILTQYISNYENQEAFLEGINRILQEEEVRKSKRKEIDFNSQEYERQRILMFKAFKEYLKKPKNDE